MEQVSIEWKKKANYISSKDVSAAAFHKVKEEKSRFPAEFWLENEQ